MSRSLVISGVTRVALLAMLACTLHAQSGPTPAAPNPPSAASSSPEVAARRAALMASQLASASGQVAPPSTRVTRAAVQQITLANERIAIQVSSPWPTMVYQGYFPVVIEIENRGGSDEDVDLSLSRGFSGDDSVHVEASVSVPARGRVRREFFLGASRNMASTVNLEARALGDRQRLYGVGPNTPPDFAVYPVLFAFDGDTRRYEPAAGATEAWGHAAGSLAPPNVPEVVHPNVFGRGLGYVSYSPPSSASSWQPAITPIAFDELSPRYEAYTSLKGVILDTRGKLPRTEVLDALLAWTRLGGCLVLHGPEAAHVARSIPAVAAWTEERFLQNQFASNRVYACAQGALVIADERELDDFSATNASEFTALFSAINAGLVLPKQFTQSPSQWTKFDGIAALSGMELPYRGFAVLLILFAVAIGPVNLIVIKKLKRPALLLVTVPALALLFSIGLFAYGVVAQGLGTRAASSSLTWLDQRSHQSSTLELRSVFAGMPHGDGWRAGAGTSVYSMPDFSRQMSIGSLHLDFEGGTSYRGDFLPVRREARNAFLVDRAARGRLDVSRGADAVEIENGLGARIDTLVLRDDDGRQWSLETRLEPGARAQLVLQPNEENAAAMILGPAQAFLRDAGLAPGTYVAKLSRSPFTDACGIEYTEEESSHVVVGILDATETAGGAAK